MLVERATHDALDHTSWSHCITCVSLQRAGGASTSALSITGGTTNLLATHTVAPGLLPAAEEVTADASVPLCEGGALDDNTLGDLQAPPALPAAWNGAIELPLWVLLVACCCMLF